MGKQLLSASGRTATYMHEDQDGKRVIQTVSDVTPVLERAKALHNAGRTKTGMGDRHVASFPIAVIDAWARARHKTFQDVMSDEGLFTLFMKDPDNSGFVIDKASVK